MELHVLQSWRLSFRSTLSWMNLTLSLLSPVVQFMSHILTLDARGARRLKEIFAFNHSFTSYGAYYQLMIRSLWTIDNLLIRSCSLRLQ